MNQALTRGLSEEEITELKDSYNRGEIFRNRVITLLKAKLSNYVKQQSGRDYSMPAWSEFQADCNGSIRNLVMVLEMLGDDEILSTVVKTRQE